MTFKRVLAAAAALGLMCALFGCGKEKLLHCDGCGGEIRVEADSNMDEDWIIFCERCEKELFPEGVVN